MYFQITSVLLLFFQIPFVFQGVKEVDPEKAKQLQAKFDLIKQFTAKTGFIAETESISIADIGVYAFVSTLAFTKKLIINFEDYPEVQAWMAKVKAAIPNYDKANGDGLKMFEGFFREKTGLI